MDMGFNVRATYPVLAYWILYFSPQPLYIPYKAKCPFVTGQRICKEAGNSYNNNMRHAFSSTMIRLM